MIKESASNQPSILLGYSVISLKLPGNRYDEQLWLLQWIGVIENDVVVSEKRNAKVVAVNIMIIDDVLLKVYEAM